ncbi:MAG TPA: NAD(P)/FAD-dependent oxidoreductase, partial [Burkholderiales bacterium]|nr:NAD(P)/FAD-dependent oxidoreductase [Burkholderiales bacterium]
FGKPEIDVDAVRAWKESVVGKLTKGLSGLAKQRKVKVVRGEGKFASPGMMEVATKEGVSRITFDHAIIAAGSSVAKIPGFPYEDERIIDSTGALALDSIPERLLVVGGGIIGLEMATVYSALGSKITVVEWMDSLIPGADKDVVRPLSKLVESRYEAIMLKTKVSKMESLPEGIRVHFEGEKAVEPRIFDKVLMAVGRRPNGKLIGAENAGIDVDERGFIPVDKTCRTNVSNIYAIGDIVGEPMLAHKATYEAKIAAEVIAGHKAAFDALTIPSVAYTDPEVAWMGLTEREAKQKGIEYEKAVFPWAASGRSLSMGRDEGM